MTNRVTHRDWLETLGIAAFLCALLTMGTGCGALSAAANPKVAWALKDPAPMSVVVRRADVAEKTSVEVNRLLNDTPLNDDSAWLGKVGPEQAAATKDLEALRAHDLYAAGPRIVPAEVWAKELAQVESKTAAVAPAPAPAAPTASTGKVGKKGAAEKKNAKAGSKAAKTDKSGDAKAALAQPKATTKAAKYVSVLDAIDPDLGTEWGKVMEKKKALGDAQGEIKQLEAANDDKSTSDADKKANKAKIAELEKTADALEQEADKLAKEFVGKAKASASKASQAKKDRVGQVLVNLHQAVEDANIANGAAAVRYPMAATSLLDSAKQMAKIYVADVIEEKTGKRPNTQALVPGVTMEGGSVEVTLNGLTKSDLGQLSIGDVTKEVASRTSAWAKRALGLLGTISATKAVLGFEDDVINAILEGFQTGGWKAPAPTAIPEAPAAGGQPRA